MNKQSVAFPEVGLINKGTPKKKGKNDNWIQGNDLGQHMRLSLYPGVSNDIVKTLEDMTPANEQQYGMVVNRVQYGPQFREPQGFETDRIHAMLCFPTVAESWGWMNTAYNAGIQIASADDNHFITWRDPLDVRRFIVKNGEPYTPFEPGMKISYDRRGENGTRHIELPIKTEGRLRVFIPAIGRMVLFTLKTRSFYDRINIDSQMAGIQAMANLLNRGNVGGIKFWIYRQQEEHPWINSETGVATLQKKWHIQIEVDREWMRAATARMSQYALSGEIKGILAPVEDTGKFPVNMAAPDIQEFDEDDDTVEGEVSEPTAPTSTPAPAPDPTHRPYPPSKTKGQIDQFAQRFETKVTTDVMRRSVEQGLVNCFLGDADASIKAKVVRAYLTDKKPEEALTNGQVQALLQWLKMVQERETQVLVPAELAIKEARAIFETINSTSKGK